MDFYPDFFHIGENVTGNISALGLVEEDLELKVRQMVRELKEYGLCVPAYLVDDKLKELDIDYIILPKHLKDMIDNELDVY